MCTKEMHNERDSQGKKETPADVATSLAAELARSNFPRGDLAQLRRMNPDNPDVPVFWRLMAWKGLLDNSSREKAWALILHGIAIMTPNEGNHTAHDRKTSVGRALFQGGDPSRKNPGFYSEERLRRLLIARDTMLRTLLVRMFRMLSGKKQPFDWVEMTWFILASPFPQGRGDRHRMRIAREYYLAASKAKRLDT